MKPYKASILFTDKGELHLCVGRMPVIPVFDSAAIATVPGTPKDTPAWMIDAYKTINHHGPLTLMEAKLMASICKAVADKATKESTNG